MAKKKEYIVDFKYTCVVTESLEENEQRLQRLFDYITRELLNEYPHLLDDLEKK